LGAGEIEKEEKFIRKALTSASLKRGRSGGESRPLKRPEGGVVKKFGEHRKGGTYRK